MKKKKRKVLSKKEKIIIFCAGALAFLIVLSLALMPTRRNKREKINPEDIDLNKSLETVQDVVEYLESDFISMEDSKTEGYDIDIYVNFKYNLYEENISKEPYFQNFYEKIAIVTNFKSFRMIDSSKNITIEVTCTSNGISEVKINGDVNYYKNEGYKSMFITNKVTSNIKAEKQNKDGIRIGLYAAKCDDWRKNMYSQMAAVSLIPNAILDMVPLNENAKSFAKVLGMKIDGIEESLPRDELIKRMSKNNLNLYVTYSECAPMLPLESFEMNVPCLTGNNHHYFEDTSLEQYLIINNEEDPEAIKEKIEECLKNKETILDEYKIFKKKNLQEAEKEVKAFLDM